MATAIRAAQQIGLTLREIAGGMATLPPERAPTKEEWEAFAEAWRPRLEEQIRTIEGIRDRLSSCIGCGCRGSTMVGGRLQPPSRATDSVSIRC